MSDWVWTTRMTVRSMIMRHLVRQLNAACIDATDRRDEARRHFGGFEDEDEDDNDDEVGLTQKHSGRT